jgi:uncharacterized membrane protein
MDLLQPLVLKLVHVSAVILFIGNMVIGLFWKGHGDRTRAPSVMAHTLEGIIRCDRYFTVPSVLVIIGSGVLMARLASLPLLGTGWILWSLVLFTISGVAFAWQIAPLQTRLLALAREKGGPGSLDRAAYRRLSLRWEVWGIFAIVTPLAALALMVFKPAL